MLRGLANRIAKGTLMQRNAFQISETAMRSIGRHSGKEVVPRLMGAFGGQPSLRSPPMASHIRKLMASASASSGAGPGAAAGAGAGAAAAAAKPESMESKLKKIVNDQFLPLSLLGAMAIAALLPAPGVAAAQAGCAKLATIGIFFLSGLTLKGGHVKQALTSPGSFLYGVVAILLLTPLAGLAVLSLGITPKELPLGLAVFSCMPTSLSSCVTLTLAVGGNSALALLLTLTTNVLGIFTLPFMLSWVLQTSEGVELPPGPMLRSLVEQILVPLIIGLGVRAAAPSLRNWVDGNRKFVSQLSTLFLVTVPWMQVSQTAANPPSDLSSMSILATFALGMGIHALYILCNTGAASVLRLGGADLSAHTLKVRRAIILTASQKTLPVSVVVVNKLAEQIGIAAGVAVLPCVLSHLSQILFDSALVSKWLNDDKRTAEEEAKLAASTAGAEPAPAASAAEVGPDGPR